MTINATLDEYGARQLELIYGQTPLRGLEIWNVEVIIAYTNNFHVLIDFSRILQLSETLH